MSVFEDLPPGPVEPLTCTTLDGRPYERSGPVERQIGGMLGIPESEWEAKLRHAFCETLVHLIRFARRRGHYIYEQLFIELARRTADLAEKWARGLAETDKEEVVDQVVCEILELAVQLDPTRQSECLELAFVEAVQSRTVEKCREVQRHLRRRDSFVPEQLSKDGDEVQHPLEYVPDEQPDPERIVVLRDLLKIAENAVEDKRDYEMAYLHFAEGWPIADLCAQFNMSKGEVDYRMLKAKAVMKKALEASGVHGPADFSFKKVGNTK